MLYVQRILAWKLLMSKIYAVYGVKLTTKQKKISQIF